MGDRARRLASGKVLMAGGSTSAPSPTAELHDPVADTITLAGAPVAARAHPTATLLIYPGADVCCGAGVCDPASGTCFKSPKPDGTPCDDGSVCTQMDACRAGVCAGLSTVVCVPLDACHENGACDPVTGQRTNPEKPDGATCPDGACTAGVCAAVPDAGNDGGGAGGGGTGRGRVQRRVQLACRRAAGGWGGVGSVCPPRGRAAAQGAPAPECPPALTLGEAVAVAKKSVIGGLLDCLQPLTGPRRYAIWAACRTSTTKSVPRLNPSRPTSPPW